jgi:glutamate-ammonia-ligase adenylyltransferase
LIHDLARTIDPERLGAETRRVRDRLEKEKAGRRGADLDIKYGAGGMLDVYFAVRYLQLRDGVQDDIDDRTTTATLERLRASGSLNEADYLALAKGYALLRDVDHQLRLIVRRSARLPAPEHPAFRDISRRLGYVAAAELTKELKLRMGEIRRAYERIVRAEIDRDGN